MNPNFLQRSIVAAVHCLTSVTCLLAITDCGVAQQLSGHPYLSSAQIQVVETLQSPAIEIPRGELSRNIELVSTVFRVPIWIDREVPKDISVGNAVNRSADPAESVSFGEESSVTRPKTLEHLLRNWAQGAGAELVVGEGIVAIVPIRKVGLMESAIWTYHTDTRFRSWNRVENDFAWGTGASMRSVASTWSKMSGVDSEWCERIPHDLWASFRFNKLKVRAIATCLLTSMDCIATASKGASGLQVRDWDFSVTGADEQVTWNYSAADIRKLGNEHCRAWKQQFPESAVLKSGDGVWSIKAFPRAHRALIEPFLLDKKNAPNQSQASMSRPNSRGGAGRSEKQYSGQMRGTLLQALESLKGSLQIQFEVSQLSSQILNREIDIEYRNIPLSDLLQKIADDAQVIIDQTGDHQYLVHPL